MQKVQAVVSFDLATITDAITRAANTTAYTANDAISDTADEHFTFADVARPSRNSGIIVGAVIHSSANQSTKLDAEFFLFRADITDMEDNDAFDPSDAEMKTLIGVIKFNSTGWVQGDDTSGAGGNASCIGEFGGPATVQKVDMPFSNVAQDSTSKRGIIYGQLKAKNAYTPVSGEVLTVDLIIARNV